MYTFLVAAGAVIVACAMVYILCDVLVRKKYHLSLNKYTALSQPARRIVKSNAKLATEWRIDEPWLYSTLRGLDERLTVEAVDKAHSAFNRGSSEYQFSWHPARKQGGEMSRYYDMQVQIEALKNAIEAREEKDRALRTQAAFEDSEQIIEKLELDRRLLVETDSQMRMLD